MKVNGYEVTAEVEAAALEHMKTMPQFRAGDIEDKVWKHMGATRTTTNVALCQRIADRLIQRERKAKNIKLATKYPWWVWCGKKD